MDDQSPAKPDSDESGLNKIDLTQLQDFTFGTQWTEAKTSGGARPERDGGRGERRDRRDDAGRGAAPRDRRGFRKSNTPAPSSSESGQANEGAGRERRPQGEQRGFGGERPFRGGERRERPEGERTFRGGRPGRGRPEHEPYISPYFNLTCYPEDAGFAALVKAVRASCRTFQLFEIAKAVLEKNDRFVVVIQRRQAGVAAEGKEGGEKAGPLFMAMPDRLAFETEEAAVQYVLKNNLAQFFDTIEVEVEPPKGNFPIINKCGITGELLGPPNYHLYQQIIQQHHAANLGRMPFDRFREKIESVREPEALQQWQDKMKKAVRYIWKQPAASPNSASTAPMPTEAVPGPTEAPVAESAPAEAPAAEATPVAAEQTAPEAVPATALTFDTLDEARAYLMTNAREKVVRAFEQIRFHGKNLEKMPNGELKRAIEGHVERQRQFPLETANALRGRLRREGFSVFKKGSHGVTFICAVKRRVRIPGQVFSESISTLINFIERNPMIGVKQLPEKLLGFEVPATPAAASPTATVPAADAPAEAIEAATAPAAEVRALTSEQTDKLRKLHNDLRWLVMEGYVTEFSDGRLFTPSPMAPQAAKQSTGDEEHDPVDFPEAPKEASSEEAPASATDALESPDEKTE